MILKYKKTILAAFFLIILGVSIFWREEISRMFSFESESRDEIISEPREEFPDVPLSTPQAIELPSDSGKEVGKASGGLPVAVVPLFSGRDPAEVRPVPEEVKLFTEEQKARLYATIDTNGRAVKSNPSFFDGWIQIGLLKKIIGDFEGSRDAWEYAGIIQPKNSLSFSNLGELYWRYLHEYAKSETNFRISIKHKPEDIQNYVSLAELYHYSFKEKTDLADDVLLEGLGNNPGDGTLMRRLAYLYEQRGEWARALEWWEKVLVSTPGDEEVKNKIERAKLKLGG